MQHSEGPSVCAQEHIEGSHQHARLRSLVAPQLQKSLAFGAKLAAAGGKVDVALNCHQVLLVVAPHTACVVDNQSNRLPAFKALQFRMQQAVSSVSCCPYCTALLYAGIHERGSARGV